MTHLQIAARYLALHLILAPILMMRAGQVRLSGKVSLGDGGNQTLMARIRAHGNYAENTPLALIGLFALALLQAAPIALHIFGGGFLLGRVLHAAGMSAPNSEGKGRAIGMLLTLVSFIGTAIYLLILIFTSGAN